MSEKRIREGNLKRFVFVLSIVGFALSLTFAQTNSEESTTEATNESESAIAEDDGEYMAQFDWGDNEVVEGEEPILEDTPSPFWSGVKIIFFTGIFAVIAYLIVRLIVRKSGIPSADDDEVVETLLTKQIGLGNYLAVVKVGPSYYLFSLSGNGINVVDKVEDKETLDYLELHKDQFKPKQGKFIDILSFLPKSKKADKFGFMKKQKDKLKKL